MLVLDEPTNDLDIDTLELLEELLQAYAGTVFLVSHDRRFLDNVVTSTIAWEGDGWRPGLWREYEGGYEDWQLQRERARAAVRGQAARRRAGSSAAAARGQGASAAARASSATRSSANCEALPARIEALEAEQTRIGERLASPALYTEEPQRVGELQARYAQIDDELMARAGALGSAGRALKAGSLRRVAAPAFVGGRRVRAADHQPGLQVQRVEQAHRAFAVEAGPLRHLAQVGGLALAAGPRPAASEPLSSQVAQVQRRARCGRPPGRRSRAAARRASRAAPAPTAAGPARCSARLADQARTRSPGGRSSAGSTCSTLRSPSGSARKAGIGIGQCTRCSTGNTVSGTTRSLHLQVDQQLARMADAGGQDFEDAALLAFPLEAHQVEQQRRAQRGQPRAIESASPLRADSSR